MLYFPHNSQSCFVRSMLYSSSITLVACLFRRKSQKGPIYQYTDGVRHTIATAYQWGALVISLLFARFS